MRTTHLGPLPRPVSVLGIGTAALGRPAYLTLGHGDDVAAVRTPEQLERRLHEVLDAAVAAGVTYVDTARSYGRGEEFVSRWLAGRADADRLTVGSKWGYRYVGGWRVDAEVHEVKDHTIGHLERQLGESLGWLDGHLSLYQVHSATLDSGVLADATVLDRLAALRADGVAVGLSVSGPGQADTVRAALEVERDGVPLFATVQATWNPLEPSAGAALAAAAAAGWGVIVKEAVANGRLAGRDPVLAERLRASAPDHAPDAVALAAALAQPWASVVLSGAATVAQLRSNLTALDVGEVDLDALADLAEPPEAYWSARSALPWT